MKKITLPVIALVIAVCCAFGADFLYYLLSDRTGTEMKGSAIFTDGHEAFGVYGCEINDGEVVITGGDPQFALSATDEEVSAIRVFFSEPVAQDTGIQLYYAFPGEGFSEGNSIYEVIPRGATEKRISLPAAVFGMFRFDLEENVHIREIASGNEIPIGYAYHPHAMRIILLTIEVFSLLCALRFLIPQQKRKADAGARIRRKPVAAVAACNLFTVLTVVFFQPLSYSRAYLAGTVSGNVWWICLLAAAGIVLALSGLMLVFPAKVSSVLTGLSLGTGAAFLAQSLFFNSYRIFRMDTSFPIEMLNIFVWFGIVILSETMAAYYAGEQPEISAKVMCVIAVILIAVQAMDLTILMTRTKEDPSPKGYTAQEEYLHSDDYGFGEMMSLSMDIGMPYYLK